MTENKSAPTPPIVLVENLYKSYRRGSQEISVLRGINLAITEGNFVALMGPSGSGKTTLLNLIAGIDRPDEGRLLVAGTDITRLGELDLARWRAHHVGFVFQFYNLLPVLSGLENVELPLLLRDLTRKQRREHAMLALELVGLQDRVHHYPRELSGGQQQRVAIARAIVTDPTLIVADEPTGDLDKTSATEVLALLEQLNQEFNKTIIMVTHDPRAAEKAKEIHHLDKGVFDNR
jgi:putative ABC transport system ATP-binding protein